MAKDFYGNLLSGQIWSTPIAQVGLGGIGQQVTLGELELIDKDVQQAVVTLGMQNLQPGVLFGNGRIYGILQYGIGSANQTVIVDWSQTQSISLPVGKVTITAIQVDGKGAPLLTMPVGQVVNPANTIDVRLLLTSSLAAGDRSSVCGPTLTQTITLAPGVAQRWPIPARAKRVLVGDPRGQAGSDVQVTIIGSAAAAANFFNLANAADSMVRTDGVVIHAMADDVELISAGGAGRITLCWILDG